jgi:hypothetical protein
VLEVVQYQQDPLAAQVRRERVGRRDGWTLWSGEHLRDLGADERWIDNGAKRHEDDTILEAIPSECGDVEREPCLPGPTRARQRQQSCVAESLQHIVNFSFSPEEAADRLWQLKPPIRLEGARNSRRGLTF